MTDPNYPITNQNIVVKLPDSYLDAQVTHVVFAVPLWVVMLAHSELVRSGDETQTTVTTIDVANRTPSRHNAVAVSRCHIAVGISLSDRKKH